jgi:hypothetical protein
MLSETNLLTNELRSLSARVEGALDAIYDGCIVTKNIFSSKRTDKEMAVEASPSIDTDSLDGQHHQGACMLHFTLYFLHAHMHHVHID